MADIAPTTTELAARLAQVSQGTYQDFRFEVLDFRLRYSRDIITIALFKYHIIPTIQIAGDKAIHLEEAAERAGYYYARMCDRVKTYWEQQTTMLLDGNGSPLLPDTLEAGLAIEAEQLMSSLETPSTATELILMEIPSYVEGIAEQLGSRSHTKVSTSNSMEPNSMNTSLDTTIHASFSARIQAADCARRAFFRHHAKAAVQASVDAIQSAEELHFLLEKAWSHTPVDKRLLWSHTVVCFLAEVNRGEMSAMSYFDVSQQSARSCLYARNALNAVAITPTILNLDTIDLEAKDHSRDPSSMTAQNATAVPEHPTSTWNTPSLSSPIQLHVTRETPLMYCLVGKQFVGDAEEIADEICEGIRRRFEKCHDLKIYGRISRMRITFAPDARDITSIWYKISRSSDPASSAKSQTTPERYCEWLLVPLVNWNYYAFQELRRSKHFPLQKWTHVEKDYKSTLKYVNIDLDFDYFNPDSEIECILAWLQQRAQDVVSTTWVNMYSVMV